MTNAIEVKGLGKHYGEFALRDLSFTLPGGAILGLIGENGAGKTTTIRCLLGLARPEAGEVRIFGRDTEREGEAIRQEVGIALDECLFHEILCPRDLEPILGPIYRDWDSALFRRCLEKYQLPERKEIRDFSRGMKMKLSLAAALSHHPRLLVLDEVTAGLDPVVRDEILEEFLAFVQDEEHAILLSSHIVGDLEKIADYLLCLHRGSMAFWGNKEELMERFGRAVCGEEALPRVDPSDLLRVRRGRFGCELLVKDRNTFQVRYPELTVEPVDLEDILLLLGKGEAPCGD